MKASLELWLAVSSMAVHATATETNSVKGGLSTFLRRGIPSIPLGNLTLPNELPMPSGLPIPSNLPIPIALPKSTHIPSPSRHSQPTGFHRQSKRQLFGITENGVQPTLAANP
jgi:hypothetical protein